LAGLIALFPELITVIPKYQKWAPVFVPLVFLSVNAAIAAFSTQLTNLLTSVGRIKTTLKLMVMWTSLSWVILPLLSKKWGISGAAVGYALVSLSSFVILYITKKILNWSIFNSIIKPLLASWVMGIILYLVKNIFPYNIYSFVLLVVFGIVTYSIMLYLLVGASLVEDVKKTIASIFSKK